MVIPRRKSCNELFYFSSNFNPKIFQIINNSKSFNSLELADSMHYQLNQANLGLKFLGVHMLNFLKQTYRNEKGQGIMEYVIISCLVGIVCIATVKTLGDSINKRVKKIDEEIKHSIDI